MRSSAFVKPIVGLPAEKKLRENEELFRQVFEHAPFGMCVIDLDGGFLQVNATLCRILGYSEQELVAKTWEDLTHPDDRTFLPGITERLHKQSNESVEVKKRYMHRSGAIVWARTKNSVVRDSVG